MGEIDPSGGKSFLIGPRNLHYVSECRNLDGALNPISPNRIGNALRHPESIGVHRNMAILEVPPHRYPYSAALLLVPPLVVVGPRRLGGKRRKMGGYGCFVARGSENGECENGPRRNGSHFGNLGGIEWKRRRVRSFVGETTSRRHESQFPWTARVMGEERSRGPKTLVKPLSLSLSFLS